MQRSVESFVVCAVASLVFITRAAIAQEVTDDASSDDIVVTATRTARKASNTPGDVTVIDRKELEAAGGADIGDVLAANEGIQVRSYGGPGSTASAHLRGTYGVHTKVLSDGRSLTAPSLGSSDLSMISPLFIERIEVVRGPASTLYGAGAVGGVVQVLTRAIADVPVSEASFSYGTYNTRSLSTMWSSPSSWGGALVGFSEFATNGHRHNAAYEATEFLAKLAVSADEGALLTFTAGGQSSRSGRPGPLPAEDYADRSLSQQLLGTADASSLVDAGESLRGYVQGEAKIGGLKVRVSFDSWDDDSRQDWYNFSSEHITQNSSMVTTKPELDVSFSHLLREDMTVLGGCSGEYDEVSFRTIEENIATSALTETERTDYRGTGALWGQVEFDSQPWSVLAGVRYDEPSDFDGKATGRLIGAWTDETGLRVEASVGSAYRAPSLNDLNWPADPYTEGNPNLEPENAREADLSVRWSRGGTSGTHIRATGFSKQVDGMIVWGPDATGIWRPENLNDVEINGAEIAADVPIPGGLRARVGYTFLDAQETGPRVTHVDYMAAEPNTFQESTRDLAYTPTHKVDAALEWSLQTAAGQVRLGITASWISEVIQYYETWEETVPFTEYDVTYPTKELAAHTLVGLNASWSWRGGEAFLRLNNLLDEEYATQFGYTLEDGDYPAPGRSVSAGARIRF